MRFIETLRALRFGFFQRVPDDGESEGERRVVWEGEIPNWRAVDDEHDSVEPGSESIPAKLVVNCGYGGVSILLDQGLRREFEIHVAMDNWGPTLRVYVPGREEPALNLILGEDAIRSGG